MEGKREGLAREKIIAAVVMVLGLAAAIAGVVIYQTRKSGVDEVYLAEARYIIRLTTDGEFSFGDMASSQVELYDPNAPKDWYRWEGETLVLEYGDLESVLYFQKDGDTLVFQKGQSVLPGNIHLLDKTVFTETEIFTKTK